MSIYGAAILDVVGSKSMANRAGLQDRLNEAIGEFNLHFRAILPVPAGITVGDEWEFLTERPGDCYKLIEWFQDALRPAGVEIYAGLGIGTLSTPLAAEIRQMDGACFHLARRALVIAKGHGGSRRKYIFSKRNRVYCLAAREEAYASEDGHQGEHLSLQEIVNILIENNEILKARMTGKQRQVFLDYQQFNSYRRLAKESGIRQTPGGISQKLNAAEYFTIRRNERTIGILLELLARGESS